MENKEKLLEAFTQAGKPLKAGEAAELANIDKKVADKLIKELVQEGSVVSPKRCYYEAKK
jgi:DNA-binding IclR family transcriptional regulator